MVACPRAVCYREDVSKVVAAANIALVKYWGKRDSALNLPAAGSLSLTLEALRTETEVELIDAPEDELVLDGVVARGAALARTTRFLDEVRRRAGRSERARVRSQNHFPSAAGLASSASGFAALAVAGAHAFGLEAGSDELSELARLGSGSAARSIHGGFVRMSAGLRADGKDAIARPFEGARLQLHAAIAVMKAGEKEVSSRDGMEVTRETSPYHASWIQLVERDLEAAESALRSGDLERLVEVTEGSCLAMHANAMAARPGIIYFLPATLWALDRVRRLRAAGVPVMFTIDAGPHVVALSSPEHVHAIARALSEHPDVDRVITSGPGEGARLVAAGPSS